MNKNEIKKLIRRILSEREEVFLKEQDIQLYLAMKLIDTNMFDNVFLEYRVPIELINGYIWSNDNKIDIDIIIEKNDQFFPIEIKYKTKETEINRMLFNSHDININLTKDGAETNNTYFVWKDVKRNEIISSTFENVLLGLTLFITNEDRYSNGPRTNTQYYPFSLRNSTEVSNIEWNGASESKLEKLPNFELENGYVVNWEELQNMNGNFKLLLL
jgi:hypothetical protein